MVKRRRNKNAYVSVLGAYFAEIFNTTTSCCCCCCCYCFHKLKSRWKPSFKLFFSVTHNSNSIPTEIAIISILFISCKDRKTFHLISVSFGRY